MASGAGLPQWMAPGENLWGLQRYTVKKPGEMRISKSEISDLDLKILNPHIWAPAGAVGAVGKAVLVSLAISLGTPVPHARYLKEHVTDYADADVWGDSLLNKAENGSTSWKATHNQIAAELASIATDGGVPATAVERKIPFLDATTRRRGDLMTTVGGLIPFVGRPAYNKHTRLIMDVRRHCASWTHFHNSQSRLQTKMHRHNGN